jgi:hypothetical protein
MGELIGLAEFAEAKRRRHEAEAHEESASEERAEALLEGVRRYRMSTQRRERRRLAAARRIEQFNPFDRRPV